MSKVDKYKLGTMGVEGVALAVSLVYFCSIFSSSGGRDALGYLPPLPYFRNCKNKNTGLTLFSDLMSNTVWCQKSCPLITYN